MALTLTWWIKSDNSEGSKQWRLTSGVFRPHCIRTEDITRKIHVERTILDTTNVKLLLLLLSGFRDWSGNTLGEMNYSALVNWAVQNSCIVVVCHGWSPVELPSMSLSLIHI